PFFLRQLAVAVGVSLAHELLREQELAGKRGIVRPVEVVCGDRSIPIAIEDREQLSGAVELGRGDSAVAISVEPGPQTIPGVSRLRWLEPAIARAHLRTGDYRVPHLQELAPVPRRRVREYGRPGNQHRRECATSVHRVSPRSPN